MRRSRGGKQRLLMFVAALLLAASWYAISHFSSAVIKAAAKPVAVAVVARADLSHKVNITAELMPYQDIKVYAKVAGYLQSIAVDIGDQVKAGQVLAVLDLPEERAQLARAKADLEIAKLDYERLAGVGKKRPGLVAQQEIDDSRAAYEAAKAKEQYAQTIVGYAQITAPFDGVITKRLADPGALIQAGVSSNTQPMPVVYLAENTKLRLEFPVQESIVPQMKPGLPVIITIEASTEKIHSNITRIADKVDASTRTMQAQVDLENPDLHLTPGMYAEVNIALDSRKGVLTVPIQAVVGTEHASVLAVGADNKLEERQVTLGLQAPDKVEITSGLAEGERVVFGSRSGLQPGMIVDPKPVEATP